MRLKKLKSENFDLDSENNYEKNLLKQSSMLLLVSQLLQLEAADTIKVLVAGFSTLEACDSAARRCVRLIFSAM